MSPLRRYCGIAARGMLIAAIVIAGIVVIAGAALMTAPVRKFVASGIEARISDLLMSRVTIGSVRTNVLSGIDVYDIVLADPDHGDSAYIRHCRVVYSVMALVKRRISIDKIIIEDAYVSGVRTSRDVVRWPFLPKRRSSPPSLKTRDWTLSIGSAKVTNVNARYFDTLFPMTATLDGICGDIRFFRLDSVFARIRSGTGSVRSPWWSGGITAIEATGAVSSALLSLDSMRIRGDSSQLSGRGVSLSILPKYERGEHSIR